MSDELNEYGSATIGTGPIAEQLYATASQQLDGLKNLVDPTGAAQALGYVSFATLDQRRADLVQAWADATDFSQHLVAAQALGELYQTARTAYLQANDLPKPQYTVSGHVAKGAADALDDLKSAGKLTLEVVLILGALALVLYFESRK